MRLYRISGYLILALLGWEASSCRAISRKVWADQYLEPGGMGTAKLSLKVENSKEGLEVSIGDAEIEKNSQWKVSSGRVTLSLPVGARSGARRTVRLLDLADQRVARELGIDRKVRLHFTGIRVPSSSIRKFTAKSSISESEMKAPFPVRPGVKDAEAAFGPGSEVRLLEVIYHELYEYELMLCTGHPRALPDIGLQGYGITWRDRMYTRWFRDGFATFAAHKTIRAFDSLRGASRRELRIGKELFSALAQRRSDLFRWHQFSGKHDDLNYPASLGLFVLLEEKFGNAKMREWIEAMRDSTLPDGRSILAAAKQAYGRSLSRIVEGWYFPETIGPFLDSWEKGGKKAGESLLVDGKRMRGRLNAEMEIFRTLERGEGLDIRNGDQALAVPKAGD